MVPPTVDDKIADALHPPLPPSAREGPHAIDDKLGTTNQNPWGMPLWDLLKEDFRTHDREWFSQGLWALALHRFGNWRMGINNRWLRIPFSLIYKFLYKCVEWTCGISLNYPVKVGRRVRIWHHSGMILGARSIGNDVHIRQNTTFGVARRGDHRSLKPIIEDRVDIGAGVVIAGAITIGHDSVIGANAVVLKDVPPYSLAVGVPAKVIKSFDPTQKIAAAFVAPPPADVQAPPVAAAPPPPAPAPETENKPVEPKRGPLITPPPPSALVTPPATPEVSTASTTTDMVS
jgi:serine O-acetyltransferase